MSLLSRKPFAKNKEEVQTVETDQYIDLGAMVSTRGLCVMKVYRPASTRPLNDIISVRLYIALHNG